MSHSVPVSIRQEINNGLLKTRNAMPQKDSTSDNQGSFSTDRRVYNDSWTQKPAITALNPPHYGMAGRIMPTIFDGTHSANQKKWLGNRDASEVTRRARVQGVGLGSFIAAGQSLSFESHANNNTVNQALSRVRGGGAVAPAKKGHSTQFTYVPSPKNIPLVPALKVANGYKMPPTKYAGKDTYHLNWVYKNQNTP